MHKIFFLLLFISPNYLFGQETKKVIDKSTREIFFVLKSDKTTKHGEYNKFNFRNALLVKGFYKQGAKDSIWECYSSKGELSLKYSLLQAHEAMQDHDMAEFEKYVNVESVAGNLIDDMAQQKGLLSMINPSSLAIKQALQFMKPQLAGVARKEVQK